MNRSVLNGDVERRRTMTYTGEELEKKILGIYPDIRNSGVSLQKAFDAGRDSWILTFTKKDRQRHAFIHRSDADACMAGGFCVYLWGLVYQYLRDLDSK